MPSRPVPWVIKEFDLIDLLLSQLESMDARSRRRLLMTMQYLLVSSDIKQTGDLDGFTILNVLINCGFQLQKSNRMQLLRAAEDLGGKVGYVELFRLLLSTCAEWTVEEKSLVNKILQGMGITVNHRRMWLAKLRSILTVYSYHGNDDVAVSLTDDDMGVPPASFLHCLRECGLQLSVDQEAVLLDCLDTEQLSKDIANTTETRFSDKEKPFLIGGTRPNIGVALIRYSSFVNFCARHCGDWFDAAPEVDEAIRNSISAARNPLLGVQEFFLLLKSFDDKSTGSISSRTFQICCNRSRLFAELPEHVSIRLTEVLTVEGGGKIKYPLFEIYLRTIISQIKLKEQNSSGRLIRDLLKQVTDQSNTIRPLRNWMMRNVDKDSNVMTLKDMSSMFHEFGVSFNQLELDDILTEVRVNMVDDGIISLRTGATQSLKSIPLVDCSKLLRFVFQFRPHWTQLFPSLYRRLESSFKHIGSTMSDQGHESTDSEGYEMVAITRTLARFKPFATLSSDDSLKSSHRQMVERDIFTLILKNTGIQLAVSDVDKLVDATDCTPAGSHIDCNILLDLLPHGHGQKSDFVGYASQLSEAGEFALNHLRMLLWRSAARLQRDQREWETDVRTLFRGFDPYQTGVVSLEDFQRVLSLLNASVNDTTLLDITSGSRIIRLDDILSLLLVPPTKGTSDEFKVESTATITSKFNIKNNIKAMDKDSAVSKVLHLTRKRLGKFILSDQSLEDTWVSLLKVFQKFDPKDISKVSPRDFYIAVSVLIDGDEAVLNQADWAHIIDHFKSKESYPTRTEFSGNEIVMVDYMAFCEAVLESKPYQDEDDDSVALRIENGKRNVSKGPRSTRKEDSMLFVKGSTFGKVSSSSTVGRTSRNVTVNNDKSRNGNETDIISNRFNVAMDKYSFSRNMTASSSSHNRDSIQKVPVKSKWNTDEIYTKPKIENNKLKNATGSRKHLTFNSSTIVLG